MSATAPLETTSSPSRSRRAAHSGAAGQAAEDDRGQHRELDPEPLELRAAHGDDGAAAYDGVNDADGWLRRVGPWVGIGTSPAALMMGGGVAERLQGAALLAAIAVGVPLLAGAGRRPGHARPARRACTLAGLTRRAAAHAGSRRTASLAMLAMMLGWFALNASVAGVGLGAPDRGPGPRRHGRSSPPSCSAVVWLGLDALSWSALAAGAATVALAA